MVMLIDSVVVTIIVVVVALLLTKQVHGIGLSSCCKEDAQKCSCSFYTWLDVPKIKPTSKGTKQCSKI